MVLFLVLNIGAILYAAVHQRLALEHPRGPVSFLGSRTTRTSSPTRSSRRPSRTPLYYAIARGSRSTMAIGLFLAVIVNQKIRGQTFFRAAFYFPAIASSAAITVAVDLHLRARRPVQRHPGGAGRQPAVRAPRLRARPELVRRPGHRPELGDPAQRLDHVGHVHAVLPRVPPVDQHTRSTRPPRSTAPGRWQTFWRITFPLLAPGPLLRRDGRGHRGAPAVRPGDHRRRRRTATRTTRS